MHNKRVENNPNIEKKNTIKATRLHSLVQSYRISNLLKQKVLSHTLFKAYICKYQVNDR